MYLSKQGSSFIYCHIIKLDCCSNTSMEKSSNITALIPTVVFKNTLLHLPGVTFNMTLSNIDALTLLNLFNTPFSSKMKKSIAILKSRIKLNEYEKNDSSIIKLSKDSEISVNKLNEIFTPLESKQPIFACLPADSNGNIVGNIAVISRLTGLHILANGCVLSLKGESKGKLMSDNSNKENEEFNQKLQKQYTYIGELFYEILLENKEINVEELAIYSDKIINGIKDNLKSCKTFLNDYSKLSTDEEDSFKNTLLKLNPLAELLSIQLSEVTTSTNLSKLDKFLNSITNKDINKLSKICDIYVAIFPFSFNQELEYLQSIDLNTKFDVVLKLTKFVSILFNEYLNIDYVYESWNRLGKLQNGKILQSKFIVNHFNSLKELLDKTSNRLDTNKNSKSSISSKSSHTSGSPSSFSTGNVFSNSSNNDDNDLENIEEFVSNIDNYNISKDGKKLLLKDFKRLKKMQSSTSEYQQLRNYFDIVMDVPWSISIKEENDNDQKILDQKQDEEIVIPKEDDISIDLAKKILNEDHFGMESVKERILEHIAILKLQKNIDKNIETKSPILLLNGPPGVGKTSLAKSIARSMNCEFQRISLGGINDFADLKGHRRTYVGAIPGLLIQSLRKSNSINKLVILLDEIDKIGAGNNKGNPEAALLEILDPEQNSSFTDHYIGFPVDLSKIIFIATSNDKWDISEPLLDRMETIDLDGYNCKEKVKIGKQFILPRQCKRNGLSENNISIKDDILEKIANDYTHEAGIRNFERLINKICRKKAVELLISSNKKYKSEINEVDLIKYLGVPISFSDSDKFSSEDSIIQEKYGLVNGLSYNSNGSGSLLKFEMIGIPGSQNISCTGRLGGVLLESCEIAETLVSHLIHTNLFINYDESKLIDKLNDTSVHMHVPEGGIKKDGPSAGITMTLCYLSLILELPVPSNIAMTGEITLSAKVLPIGGLKEKLLGASLTGKIDKVIVPRLNRKDLIDAYVESIPDREESKIELTKLVLEEEKCLLSSSKKIRFSFSSTVEDWVREEYKIDIKYVDDFIDVINEVWNGDLTLVRKEVKANL